MNGTLSFHKPCPLILHSPNEQVRSKVSVLSYLYSTSRIIPELPAIESFGNCVKEGRVKHTEVSRLNEKLPGPSAHDDYDKRGRD